MLNPKDKANANTGVLPHSTSLRVRMTDVCGMQREGHGMSRIYDKESDGKER
jgi:hypothetical protein